MKILVPALWLTFIYNLSVNAQVDTGWMKQYDFVYLDEILENAQYEVRYASRNNFLGKEVDGYHSERLVMTRQAAEALAAAEKMFNRKGYGLKIFDTYRPQRAVNHFMRWAKVPSDTLTKSAFYPEQKKSQLFKLGYISSRSGHSRGSTIDLTLYHLSDGREVDMGGSYDYFGERSHHVFTDLSKRQATQRRMLKSILLIVGFKPYSKEWWHYTLKNEPYPKRYFDFIVE